MNDESAAGPGVCDLGRRDLMKIGAGAVATAMQVPSALGQDLTTRPEATFGAPVERNTPTSGTRSSGNGPMDDTTRQLVSYVHSFSESNLTDRLVDAFDNTMLDSIAALITGFDSEPARICLRMADRPRATSRAPSWVMA
jgi:hypothetical protein